jgi:lycopene cyclase domain-containing protein
VIPEYTIGALAADIAVVLLELLWARTGIFRTWSYWVTLLVVFGFQIPVDGWLTKLSAPIVIYAPGQFSGVRGPFGIPLEDFAYGFALVTLALVLWVRAGRPATPPAPDGPDHGRHPADPPPGTVAPVRPVDRPDGGGFREPTEGR